MKIAIGSDHAGFKYKESIRVMLSLKGYDVLDCGTFFPTMTDYPIWCMNVAKSVSRKKSDLGIVIGGSGNGEAIVSNKAKGIRCALIWSSQTALLAKQHNNANMIAIGARTISLENSKEYILIWINSIFEGGRHTKRLEQITEYENDLNHHE